MVLKRFKKVVCALSIFTFLSTQVFAGGYQVYMAGSAEAKGVGAAVVGRDDIISNAWYNPAAVMGFEEDQYSTGCSFAIMNHKYDPGNGQDSITMVDKVHMLPNSHWIHKASKDVTAAISMYTPYGLSTNWHEHDIRRLMDSGLYSVGPVNALLTGNKPLPVQTSLEVPYLTGTLATKFSDKFSFAGGLSLIHANFRMRMLAQAQLTANPAIKAYSNFVKYQADGWGVGYTFAGHYKMDDEWGLGFRYLSRGTVKMNGTVEDHPAVGNKGMHGTLQLPGTLTLGVSKKHREKWTFSSDITWTEWSKYKRLEFIPNEPAGTGGGFSSQKDWRDTLAYRFGVEYRACDKWTYKLGYTYDNSPVPDHTRSLELPGTDGHVYTCGVKRTGPKWTWEVAYSYMDLTDGKAGSVPLSGIGQFVESDNHFLTINLSRRF